MHLGTTAPQAQSTRPSILARPGLGIQTLPASYRVPTAFPAQRHLPVLQVQDTVASPSKRVPVGTGVRLGPSGLQNFRVLRAHTRQAITSRAVRSALLAPVDSTAMVVSTTSAGGAHRVTSVRMQPVVPLSTLALRERTGPRMG